MHRCVVVPDRLEQLSKRKVSIIALLGLVVLLGALAIWARTSRDWRDEVAGETTITSGSFDPSKVGVRVPNDMAIERLSYVICAHRAACASMGTNHDERFIGDDECGQDQREKLNVELDRAETCVIGIDAVSLDQCVAEIEREPCGQNAHAPRSLALCRASVLCPR
jgi:hypothetical protein